MLSMGGLWRSKWIANVNTPCYQYTDIRWRRIKINLYVETIEKYIFNWMSNLSDFLIVEQHLDFVIYSSQKRVIHRHNA